MDRTETKRESVAEETSRTIDWKALEADREVGTPGPWRLGSWGDNVFGTGPRNEWLSVCRVKRDDAAIEESNDGFDARRIARVPDLEAYAMRAKRQLEAAEALARLLDNPNQNDRDPGRYHYDWCRVDDALAAYEAAKGGEG